VFDFFSERCNDKISCEVDFTHNIPWHDGCSDTFEDVIVRASCGSYPALSSPLIDVRHQIFVAPFVTKEGYRRILIVNKQCSGTAIIVDSDALARQPTTVILDAATNMTTGPERVKIPVPGPVEIPPFSVQVIYVDEDF